MRQQRPMTEEECAYFQKLLDEHFDTKRKLQEARRKAIQTQKDIDRAPSRYCDFVVIVAVDQYGGIAKDKTIPWRFPEDMKWFQNHTKGHKCVMGCHTYEEINTILDEKAKDSVLPDRECFVVSSTLADLPNAKVIKSLTEIEKHLVADERETVFVIGGERLFREALALANTVYMTIINDGYNCDQHFPVTFVTEHFTEEHTYKVNTNDKLRFTTWKRND